MKTGAGVRALGMAGIAFLTLSHAQALDGTWTGISGNWSDTTDPGGVWSGGVVANGVDAIANFTGVNITANQTITVDAAHTVGTINFTDTSAASNDLTISGAGALTLETSTGVPVINPGNRTLTISSPLAGIGGLQKSGAGTLTRLTATSPMAAEP